MFEHNARFSADKLRVVKGQADLHSVDIPGFPIRRWYCRKCDIRVLHDKLSSDGAVLRKSIPVGCVTSKVRDLDPAWAAKSHIFYSERACDFDDDTPKWQAYEDASERWQPEDKPQPSQDASDPPSLPLPAPPITATCHCGQTRLEAAEAGPLEVYACHCRACQQITGSSFAWNAFFAPDQLRVTAGEAQLRRFRKDGSPRETFRCGRCLDRMFRHLEDDEGNLFRKVLPIGIVDKPHGSADPAWLPRYHIRYSQRAMDMPDGQPKWSGVKDSSELLHD
jgi:hypothetical protein